MSWTIQTTTPDNPDMKSLEKAIIAAHADKILMFCSTSDQGAHAPEKCYPGDWNLGLRIGGATFDGDKLTWVDNKVDFWFPGRNVPFPADNETKTVVYESGSSVATAAASGLAAVLLYAARLAHNNATTMLRGRTAMETAFKRMASGSDGKFPRTTEILGKLFTDFWWTAKARQNTTTVRGGLSIETLAWDSVSKEALKDLLSYITRA
jgi:hypothetical protein